MTSLSFPARLVLTLTVCLVAATVASTAQSGRTRALLTATPGPQALSAATSTADGAVRRSRAVRVDFSILRAPGERLMLREPGISLELFPNVTVFAEFVRYDPSPGG